MRFSLLFILFVFIISISYSQEIEIREIRKPEIWLRIDSVSSVDSLWYDVSGNSRHGIWSGESSTRNLSLINYNKSFNFSGNDNLFIPNVSFPNKSLTNIIVYQVEDSISEQFLWRLAIGDSTYVGLTSQRILNEDSEIRYRSNNSKSVIINSLFQNWNTVSFESNFIEIGSNSEYLYTGKIAEFLSFDNIIEDLDLLCWASYLAIKYGVNLYQSNYYNSNGDVIWDYEKNRNYSYSVIGLGRDSIVGLNQKQTKTVDTTLVFGVGNYVECNTDNIYEIEEGNYLLLGCDSLSLKEIIQTELENGLELYSYGNCLVEATGAEASNISTFLQIDASNWEGDLLRYHLFIDRSGQGNFSFDNIDYYPAERLDSSGILYFNNIYWDTDQNGQDLFCFAYLSLDTTINDAIIYSSEPDMAILQLQSSGQSVDLIPGIENIKYEEPLLNKVLDILLEENLYELSPNPSNGSFSLSIQYTEVTDVTVNILSMDGRILRVLKGTGSSHYLFEGYIANKGHYLVEINSSKENKNLKFIVN